MAADHEVSRGPMAHANETQSSRHHGAACGANTDLKEQSQTPMQNWQRAKTTSSVRCFGIAASYPKSRLVVTDSLGGVRVGRAAGNMRVRRADRAKARVEAPPYSLASAPWAAHFPSSSPCLPDPYPYPYPSPSPSSSRRHPGCQYSPHFHNSLLSSSTFHTCCSLPWPREPYQRYYSAMTATIAMTMNPVLHSNGCTMSWIPVAANSPCCVLVCFLGLEFTIHNDKPTPLGPLFADYAVSGTA
mmetsp:Transcript_12575/g.21468  ORF Transcript_12575/g.21468 Transcript_12575/m.21468 type:complete len:244 (-) Transcript_12575:114-845(-)